MYLFFNLDYILTQERAVPGWAEEGHTEFYEEFCARPSGPIAELAAHTAVTPPVFLLPTRRSPSSR